jgi:hypothetical protein
MSRLGACELVEILDQRQRVVNAPAHPRNAFLLLWIEITVHTVAE